MAVKTDRVGELLEESRRTRRVIITPEGVPLDVQIAGNGERIIALILDLFFMTLAIIMIYVLLILAFIADTGLVSTTVVLFLAFLVRNTYFLNFELIWQGRTPGKRIMGLRVINRQGGELSPSAIIARNFMREVEIFMPFTLLLGVAFGGVLQNLALLGWALIISSIPLFNKWHLRAGDLIAGTQVIAMPNRMLMKDLSTMPKSSRSYTFTHSQLSVYGNFELQVLEELLRRPSTEANKKLLADVCVKIRRKIGWEEEIPPQYIWTFLNDFYTAERASLERDQLFGRIIEDKESRT